VAFFPVAFYLDINRTSHAGETGILVLLEVAYGDISRYFRLYAMA